MANETKLADHLLTTPQRIHLQLRLDDRLHRELKQAASASGVSLNEELVRRLRQSLDVESIAEAVVKEVRGATTIDIYGLNRLRDGIEDVIGYLADNSCSDPGCCGGPFYEQSDFDSGVEVLASFGLTYREGDMQ